MIEYQETQHSLTIQSSKGEVALAVLTADRLVADSDFDGTIASFLIQFFRVMNDVEPIQDVVFTHPHQMQKNAVEITPATITVDLPFNSKAGLYLDHHRTAGLTALQTYRSGRENLPMAYFNANCPSSVSLVAEALNLNDGTYPWMEELVRAGDIIDAGGVTLEMATQPQPDVITSLSLALDRDGADDVFKHWVHAYMLFNSHSKDLLDLVMSHPVIKSRYVQALTTLKEGEAWLQHPEALPVVCDELVMAWMAPLWDPRDDSPIYRGERTNGYQLGALHPTTQGIGVVRAFPKEPDTCTISFYKNNYSGKELKMNYLPLVLKWGGGGHTKACGCTIKRDDWPQFLKDVEAMVQKARSS